MATVKMIQSWQRSRIYGASRGLGITTKSQDKSDELHQLIFSRTGKNSLTKLTFEEANGVIGELDHRQRFGSPAASPPQKFVFTPVPGKMSHGQYRKVLALICELRKYDPVPVKATVEKRVAGVVKQYLHMTVSPDNPYSWLSFEQGSNLIECIKGILATEKGRASARSEIG